MMERVESAARKGYVPVLLRFMVYCFTVATGLDSYEFYLNGQLILKQDVNQPMHHRKLDLNKAGDNDELRIRYKHCTGTGLGSGRSIVLKGPDGKLLKKWGFADVSGSDPGMIIPVKVLRQLEKHQDGRELTLHYTSQEHPRGEMLASLLF